MRIDHQEDPLLKRAAEYPAMADQLDALWKIVNQLLGKLPVNDPSAAAIAAQVQAVKNKYPKGP